MPLRPLPFAPYSEPRGLLGANLACLKATYFDWLLAIVYVTLALFLGILSGTLSYAALPGQDFWLANAAFAMILCIAWSRISASYSLARMGWSIWRRACEIIGWTVHRRQAVTPSLGGF